MSMLRTALRTSALRKPSTVLGSSIARQLRSTARLAFSTQSGDDTQKPTALAKLHLEDGTTIVGTSFGSHEAVEGEVRSVALLNIGTFCP